MFELTFGTFSVATTLYIYNQCFGCVLGYTGTLCDVQLDYCLSSPCGSMGTCRPVVQGYVCDCVDGISGLQCEIDNRVAVGERSKIAIIKVHNKARYLHSCLGKIILYFKNAELMARLSILAAKRYIFVCTTVKLRI